MPAHNVAAPVCREAEFSRDNHLGNGIGGYPLIYNWTVPDHIHEHCAIRIRYVLRYISDIMDLEDIGLERSRLMSQFLV